MMLVVVGQERKALITMLDPGLEDSRVLVDHLLVAMRLENNVREFAGGHHGRLLDIVLDLS